MSDDGGRPRRRRNNDGKKHAAVFYSATKEEEEVVSLSSDVETDSDWQGSSDSGGYGETSDEDMVVEEEEKTGGLDLASLSESVSRLLHPETRSVDGANLKLVDCKAYLRNHGLRVGGTKAVCLERINEHLRIKDGNGEQIYPRSSFVINCTGDVCKGDVVLFTQKLYESFDKVKRCGSVLGRRAIAGRVVKESYGSAKQQHTFTVEVLWSKGVKPLPLLFPLLVKGRNLYKMRTFRQVWEKEEERQKVLDEKHKRGSEARRIRAFRISKLDPGKGGRKNAKDSKPRRQPQKNRETELEQRRPFLEHPRPPCAVGTSRLETSRNFEGNSHPNLQSDARDDYPQQHGTTTELMYNLKGTTSTMMPRSHKQHHGPPSLLPPPPHNHSVRHTIEVRSSSFNPGSTRYIPEPEYNQMPRVRYPTDAYDPRTERRFGPYEYDNRTERRFGLNENDPRAERRFGQYEYDPRTERRFGQNEYDPRTARRYEDRADRRGYRASISFSD